MAIPESQLETWSHIGSIAQSAQTYQTIRGVLEGSSAPYAGRQFTVFLQGSYYNDTNVVRESDVDIVIRLDETYVSDTGDLGEGAKANYNRGFSAATYTFDDFRAEVIAWLRANFGSAVAPGKKAIAIKGAGNRRDADVLPCIEYRRYRADSNGNDEKFEKGICFWRTDNGNRVENFPKQHSDNCTTKHQNTHDRFKPMVRVFKNMRYRMVEKSLIEDGVAPSYFIEGLLWNVPEAHFTSSLGDTFVAAFNWIIAQDKTKLACASDLHWLVRDNTETCWPTANFDTYIDKLRTFWNNGGN